MCKRTARLHQEVQVAPEAYNEQPQWVAGLLLRDELRLACLTAVRDLHLADCWIGAGFVRNKVWDVLHGHAVPTPLNDVDVLYFDRCGAGEAEAECEARLAAAVPGMNWQVRNQARMHVRNSHPSYQDTSHAISCFVETATAVATRLDNRGRIKILSPLGLDDLVHLKLRPTPTYENRMAVLEARVKSKRWLQIWPRLETTF